MVEKQMARRATDPMHITHRAFRPHFESRPYRPSPARREHIHGALEPLDEYEPWPLVPKVIVILGLVGAVWLIVAGGKL